MATDDDKSLREEGADEAEQVSDEADARPAPDAPAEADDAAAGEAAAELPAQLGHKRFVYAAYLAAGIAIAFIVDKALGYAWYKLHDWKPESLPEPQDEITVPIAAVIAIAITLYYWNRTRARTLVEEVAEELTKVTWPSKDEVTNSTTVVVLTTLFATVFFALMDQFWLWVTKHVYGS
jgi:preprotein translocase subunit SecE